MQLSSQGLNFLGLTAKKYETANGLNNYDLKAVQEKLSAFGQVGNGFAHAKVSLQNLKDTNSQVYCMINGKKELITEKSWDRGGKLEGKVPLEEGIAKGLYHIETIPPKNHIENIDNIEDFENLDAILENLRAQAASNLAKIDEMPKGPSIKKEENKLDLKNNSSFKFAG